MGLGSSIRLASAYVQMEARGQDKVEKILRDTQRNIANTAANITATGTAILATGIAGAAPFALAIKSASDLEETMNKFRVVFAERSAEVKKWGDDFGATVGRSKQQVAEFLASSQDLFVPIGFDSGAAEKMSKQVTALAVDLASFNNKADADVLRDLQAALTGSSETVKKYGILLNEAAVKQELLNQGLDPKVVTDREKVQARLNIILRGSVAAQGDAIRSADAFENQQKRLRAEISNTAAEIGNALLPAVADLTGTVADHVNSIASWSAENQEAVKVIAGLVVATIAVGGAVTATGIALSLYAKAIGAVIVAKKAYIVTSKFFASATLASRTAAFGLQGALVLLTAVIAFKLTQALTGANKEYAKFNQAMREAERNTGSLNTLKEKQHRRQIEAIDDVKSEAEKRKILTQTIAANEKELIQEIIAVQNLKKRLDDYNTSFRSAVGNKVLADQTAEYERRLTVLDRSKERLEELRDIEHQLGRGKATSSATGQDPQAAADSQVKTADAAKKAADHFKAQREELILRNLELRKGAEIAQQLSDKMAGLTETQREQLAILRERNALVERVKEKQEQEKADRESIANNFESDLSALKERNRLITEGEEAVERQRDIEAGYTQEQQNRLANLRKVNELTDEANKVADEKRKEVEKKEEELRQQQEKTAEKIAEAQNKVASVGSFFGGNAGQAFGATGAGTPETKAIDKQTEKLKEELAKSRAEEKAAAGRAEKQRQASMNFFKRFGAV